MVRRIDQQDVTDGIAEALQFVSHQHPPDFVRALRRAHDAETSAPAKAAIAQILVNSRLAAEGRRPLCQDTGVAQIFFRVGCDVRFVRRDGAPTRGLQALADEAVRRAYGDATNPLRATMVADPLGRRINTRDNTPATVHCEIVDGDGLEVLVVAKGGGGHVKARFATLNPSDSVADWVLEQVPGMGAGWCPPGVLGIGVGGSPEQAMLLAKLSLFEPIAIERPSPELWAGIPDRFDAPEALRVQLDNLDRAAVAQWRVGQVLLLSGRVLTARDAAHKRLVDLIARGQPLPVSLEGRVVYYVGPVDAVGDEAVGPAGPTTATRMDKFVETLLSQAGLLAMIGKAERGPDAIAAIRRHGAAYLAATGGAAYLLSKSIRSARLIAFEGHCCRGLERAFDPSPWWQIAFVRRNA